MTRSFVLALALVFAACDPPPPTKDASSATTARPVNTDVDDGKILARVDDVPVDVDEFTSVATRRAPGEPDEDLGLERRKEILDDLIDQKALFLEARRLGLDMDPKIQRQMIQIYLRRHVYSEVKAGDFTDEELRAFFEENRDEFIIPPKVRVRRIFIKGDPVRSMEQAKALAEEARGKVLQDPDAFPAIARTTSEGVYGRRGGELGLMSAQGRPGIPMAVVDKAFEMKVGDISEPFEADGGYNVIALVQRRDRVERTYDQMKGAVLRRAKAERHKELFEAKVQELRGKADIEVFDDRLQEVEVKTAMDFRQAVLPGRRPGGLQPPGADDGEGDEEGLDEGDLLDEGAE